MGFDREQARKTLLNISGVLDSVKLPFFLMQGTALGAYRDKDFTPTERDIDIGVLQEDLNRCIYSLVFEFIHSDFDVFCLIRPFTQVRTLIVRQGLIKADIVAFARYQGKRFACSPDEPDQVLNPYAIVHEALLLEKYEQVELFEKQFNVPSPIETYLTREYDDWKTQREDHVSRTRVYNFINDSNIPFNLLEHQPIF